MATHEVGEHDGQPFVVMKYVDLARHTVEFIPPANGGDEIITLFAFGTYSGPPTKLTVKMKKPRTSSRRTEGH